MGYPLLLSRILALTCSGTKGGAAATPPPPPLPGEFPELKADDVVEDDCGCCSGEMAYLTCIQSDSVYLTLEFC